MNLLTLQKECHQRARAAGWWHEYLTGSELLRGFFIGGKIALVHSELSEALEGFRKGKMDDHLPHRKMIEVEFADTIIRMLDIAGMLDLDLAHSFEKLPSMRLGTYENPVLQKHYIAGMICDVHMFVSDAHNFYKSKSLVMVTQYFAESIRMLLDMGTALDLDIEGAIKEKMEYNLRRADHKPEARNAVGGKSL